MKSSLILAAALSMLACSAVATAGTNPAASFDTQLNQAKAAIAKLAEDGLQKQNGSFDTQLNQAKASIAKLAEDGLAAQSVKK